MFEDNSHIGKLAVYNGINRRYEFGTKSYRVVDQKEDRSAVKLDAPGIENPWVASHAVRFISPAHPERDQRTKLDMAKNEILRLEDRLAELRKFVEVYESL